jgi:adsorption protein B
VSTASIDAIVAGCLVPLAIVILISGLDDLFLDAICLIASLRKRLAPVRLPSEAELRDCPEKRIAIFVPLWNESTVIAGMIGHNAAAIRYRNYDFFIGAYPNDEATLEAVRDLEARLPHAHLAVCPHDGPTSKADCLNWIYQRMLLFEEKYNIEFQIVITHDAEDLVHPDALAYINYYSDSFEMVQVPVLPLPTPLRHLVHGVYCDEFAEWQIRDMPARRLLGSFVPSNGVGTGYTRAALEKLAASDHNLIFEPGCLTEDYENGLRLHELGCPQVFVPLTRGAQGMVATREYFPRTIRAAIRQRTRWVMGIALQTWERHGWRGGAGQVYWFWRDRKGLLGNPISLLTNLIFLYGAVTWIVARAAGAPWGLGQRAIHPELLGATLVLLVERTLYRMVCCGRLYGRVFALGVLARSVAANTINALASVRAIYGYLRARLRGEPLVWLKTEHNYPSRAALLEHRRKLGEILVGSGYVSASSFAHALSTQPQGTRIGQHLARLGLIAQDDLYEALSLQQNLPAGRIAPAGIEVHVSRALPRQVIRDWKVLPFRIAGGNMFIASPELPTEEMARALRGFTRLALRFHLVTPANFEALTAEL